jgi:hypothetical protein
MHTTAYHRSEAMAEAKVLNWFRAALMMEEAIKVYPTTGALAEVDKANMRRKIAGWRAMMADAE